MLSAIKQSFSVYFRLMQAWTFDCACSSSQLMLGSIQVAFLYNYVLYDDLLCN